MLEFLLALLVGMLVKIQDAAIDSRILKYEFSIVLGVINGSLLALFVFLMPLIRSLILAILLATLLAGKIDALGHRLLFIISLSAIIFLNNIDALLILVFFIPAFLDEVISDYADRKKKRTALIRFLQTRPILEIFTFFFSLLTNRWLYWISLVLFDVGYVFIDNLTRIKN